MKKLLPAVVLLLSFYACQRQNQNALIMCHDPLKNFADFANDPLFRSMHPSPAPIDPTLTGKMIRLAVPGKDSANAYLVRPKSSSDHYLLLFHEWWGLNNYVKKEADMWAEELGVNVLALDFYDGKVADNAEMAGKLMQGNDAARSKAIIGAAAAYAGPKADFRTMGWCFGGGWSLQAALVLKEKVKACVMYYGMPEKDVQLLKSLGTDVLFIHASKDQWINADVAKSFEANMKTAGKSVQVYHYDADHAFANPSSPRYNEKAAKESRKVVKKYLKKSI